MVCPISFSVDGFVGGGTRFPEELARAISKRASCDFFVGGTGDDSYVDRYGLRHVFSCSKNGPNPDALSLSGLRQLGDYDVVHFHTVNKMAVGGALIGILRRQAVFLTPLGGGQRTGLGRLRLDQLFAGFPLISDYTRTECPWVTRRPNTLIFGGGNAAGFPSVSVEAVDRSGGPIVCVGRISAHKGIDVLIQALPDGADLVVCGHVLDQEYFAHLQTLAKGKRVDFVDPLDDSSLSALYSRAVAVVLPSLHEDFRGVSHPHPELLGLVLLEAMWHGTPVVASRVGGIPEIVREGENGFLVPPGDVEALRSALSRLLGDATLSVRLGAQGRTLVESRFTWAHVAERAVSFYNAVGHRR